MRRHGLTYLLLTATALFWGSNYVVARMMSGDIPPIAMTFWRFVGALAILLPFTAGAVWRHRAELRRHWKFLLILGLTGITVTHSFVYTALGSTTAVNGALFMALTPLVIPLFAYLMDGEVLSRRQAAGIGASCLGVVVLLSRGDPAALAALRFNPGDLWMLGAFPLWAFYSVYIRRRPAALPPTVLLVGVLAMASLTTAPLYLWELGRVGGFAASAGNLASLAYLALFASAFAYLAWNHGIAKIGAARAGLFMHLVPVFAAALAIVFLGEALHLYHLGGAAMVALGILLVTDPRARPAETPG